MRSNELKRADKKMKMNLPSLSNKRYNILKVKRHNNSSLINRILTFNNLTNNHRHILGFNKIKTFHIMTQSLVIMTCRCIKIIKILNQLIFIKNKSKNLLINMQIHCLSQSHSHSHSQISSLNNKHIKKKHHLIKLLIRSMSKKFQNSQAKTQIYNQKIKCKMIKQPLQNPLN